MSDRWICTKRLLQKGSILALSASLRSAACSLSVACATSSPDRGKSVKGRAIGSPSKFSVSPETCPLADVSRSREAFRCGKPSHSDFKSAEAENTVKRSSRRTGVNLQYFRLEPTPLGSERGEQPLSRCGERGVQRVRGGSRNTPLTLWPSGATRRKCILQKPLNQTHATALCTGSSKKPPPFGRG